MSDDNQDGGARSSKNALVYISLDGLASAAPHVKNVLNNLSKAISRGIGGAYRPLGRVLNALAESVAQNIQTEQRLRQLEAEHSYKQRAKELFGSEELGERSFLQVVDENVRKQKNRESIAAESVRYIGHSIPKRDATEEIDDDWLSEFWGQAERKSGAEVQTLYGRVLALESIAPGTFSLAALSVLSLLDHKVAKIFECICSLIIIDEINEDGGTPYVIVPENDPVLTFCGFKIPDFLRLEAVNLIQRSPEHSVIFSKRDQSITIGDKTFRLDWSNRSKKISFSIYSLSPAGAEILKLVSAQANDVYIEEIRKMFGREGVTLYERV